MFCICDVIQQKHLPIYKCCLKLNIHLSHRIHGGWGSGMFWFGLESSRKLSHIIISLQSLAISYNSVSVESFHRFLLWMMITLPRTATKGSTISPPHPTPFRPVFHGNHCGLETGGEAWGARPLASGKFQGCCSTRLGRSLLSIFHLSSPRD